MSPNDAHLDLGTPEPERPPVLLSARPERSGQARGSDDKAGLSRLARWLVARLRGRRSITADNTRFKRRAPGPQGRIDYDVRFATGVTMRITPTARRVYADLAPCLRLAMVRRIGSAVRPGHRVLWLGTGTGAGAAEAARLAGPSGGIVALDRDRESIRFARRRYPRSNIGFEHGGDETLAGELEGAYDGVIVSITSACKRPDWGELRRVTADEGWITVMMLDQSDVAAALAHPGLPEWITSAEPMIGPEVVAAGASCGVVIAIPTPCATPPR